MGGTRLAWVVTIACILAIGCGGGDDSEPADANPNAPDSSSSIDAANGTDGANGAGVCTFSVDGSPTDLSSGFLSATVSANIIAVSCADAGVSISFMIVSPDGPGTYPCEDGVVVGMTEMGYGSGSGADQWSSRNASMTNGSCSIVVTAVPANPGGQLQGTFIGSLRLRVGGPTPAQVEITDGVFDLTSI
jgi:hypothetical protein